MTAAALTVGGPGWQSYLGLQEGLLHIWLPVQLPVLGPPTVLENGRMKYADPVSTR